MTLLLVFECVYCEKRGKRGVYTAETIYTPLIRLSLTGLDRQVDSQQRLDEDVHDRPLTRLVGVEDDAIRDTHGEATGGVVDVLPQRQDMVVGFVTEIIQFLDHGSHDLFHCFLVQASHLHLVERMVLGADFVRTIGAGHCLRVGHIEVLSPLEQLVTEPHVLDSLDRRIRSTHLQRVVTEFSPHGLDRLLVLVLDTVETTLDQSDLHHVREGHPGGCKRCIDGQIGGKSLLDDEISLSLDGSELHCIMLLLTGVHHFLHLGIHDGREGTRLDQCPPHHPVAVLTNTGVGHLSIDHEFTFSPGHFKTSVLHVGGESCDRTNLRQHDILRQRHLGDVDNRDVVMTEVLRDGQGGDIALLDAPFARTVGRTDQQHHQLGIVGTGGVLDLTRDSLVDMLGQDFRITAEHLHQDDLHTVIQIPTTMEMVGLDEALAADHEAATRIVERDVLVATMEVEPSNAGSRFPCVDREQTRIGHGDPHLAVEPFLCHTSADHAQDDAVERHVQQILCCLDVQPERLEADPALVDGVAQLLNAGQPIITVSIFTEEQPLRELTCLDGIAKILHQTDDVADLSLLGEGITKVDRTLVVPHRVVHHGMLPHAGESEVIGEQLTLDIFAHSGDVRTDLVVRNDDSIALEQTLRSQDADGDVNQLARPDRPDDARPADEIADVLSHAQGEGLTDVSLAVIALDLITSQVQTRIEIPRQTLLILTLQMQKCLHLTEQLLQALGTLLGMGDVQSHQVQTELGNTFHLEEEGVIRVGVAERRTIDEFLTLGSGHVVQAIHVILSPELDHPGLEVHVALLQTSLEQVEHPVARIEGEDVVHHSLALD